MRTTSVAFATGTSPDIFQTKRVGRYIINARTARRFRRVNVSASRLILRLKIIRGPTAATTTTREELRGAYLSERVGPAERRPPFFIHLETPRFFRHPAGWSRTIESSPVSADVLALGVQSEKSIATRVRSAGSENGARVLSHLERGSKYSVVFSFFYSLLHLLPPSTLTLILALLPAGVNDKRVIMHRGVSVMISRGAHKRNLPPTFYDLHRPLREVFQRNCR